MSEPAETELIPVAADKPAPTWLIWAAGALVFVTALGAAVAPYLIVNHPLWLLALNPWPRHQIMVAPHSPLVPFIAVVGVRGLFACWVSYELGKHYGVRGTALLEARAPDFGRGLRTMESLFGRFSGLLLLVAPGWMTSALAGMSGITRGNTLLLSSLGLMGWASLNHQVGGWLEPYTAPVMQFMRDHMLAATLVCASLVLLYQLYSYRRTPRG
ncbi:MAG: hypothetical protein ABW321_15430 [Polyangiales bacterium]